MVILLSVSINAHCYAHRRHSAGQPDPQQGLEMNDL